jgi:RecA-family ATPase
MDRNLDSAEGFNQLTRVCEGARLVMLDPIRRFHTCDENDSGAMTALVQMLQELASRTQAAVVFAHHTNRASQQMGQGDTAGAARGSTALTDGVRWQLNLSRPTKESAKRLEIHGELTDLVLADIAKANYLPGQTTAILERQSGGVLRLAQTSARSASTASGRTIATRVKLARRSAV